MVLMNNIKYMKLFKYLVSATILSNVNMIAFAGSYNHLKDSNENQEQCQIEEMLTKISEKNLENAIGALNKDCISKITHISPHKLKKIISKQNMFAIAKAAVAEATIFNPKNPKKLLNFATFLNTGFFLQAHYPYFIPDYHEYDDHSLKNTVATIAHAYALKVIYEKPNAALKESSNQVFGLIASAKTYEESLSLIKYITHNSKWISKENENPLYHSILPIQKALAASHNAGGIYFNKPENTVKFNEIITNIIKIVQEEKETLDETLYRNYICELGRFLRYKDHRNKITDVLKNVIKNTQRNATEGKEDPTPFWLEAVSALEDNNIINANNCFEFTDANGINICNAKSSLSNKLFPNRIKYDEGKIVIFSSLPENKISKLYLALKQVESIFKRTIETLKPISNDPNERLQIYIYESYDEYMKYKSYISDLSNQEDGGIYLESIGTFYTYAGGMDLEDRIRHEYIHYLSGSYLVKGIHGSTSSFDKKWSRMTWFEEGIAEFFAGATHSDGIIKRKNKIQDIDLTNIRSIKEITNSNYGTLPSKILYSQSYALVSFLYYKEPDSFKNIIHSVKTNDVKKFDDHIESLSNNPNYNDKYKSYIQDLAKSPDLTEARITDTNSNFFALEELESIKTNLKNEGINISSCEIIASSEQNAQARFGCSGKMLGAIDEDANIKLNNSLKNLVAKDNRFIYTNCMFGNATFYCEGPLQSAKFNQLSLELRKEAEKRSQAQLEITFKGSKNHFYFFTGNTLTDTLFMDQRRQEAQGYIYNQIKDTERGALNTNENGEITYTNPNSSEDDYKKVTAQIKITEKDKTPLDNDQFLEINANIFKFKEIDERMFIYDLYLDDSGYASSSLYKNEYQTDENNKDGFRIFDDHFRNQAVNDFDFEIVENPKFGTAKITSRYIITYYSSNQSKIQNDSIKVKVRKHNQETSIITIDIKGEDQKPVNSMIAEAIKNEKIETYSSTSIMKNGRASGYIYSDIEHLLTPGFHYNYSIIKKPKCHSYFSLKEYGAFIYEFSDQCKMETQDEALILVTKVTNSEVTPVMKIKAIFQVK